VASLEELFLQFSVSQSFTKKEEEVEATQEFLPNKLKN
jgi:hypothetical protein